MCPPSPAVSIPSPSLLAPPQHTSSLFNFPTNPAANQEPSPRHRESEAFRSMKMSAGSGGREEEGVRNGVGITEGFRHHASSLLPVSSSSSLDENNSGLNLPQVPPSLSKVSFNFLYSNNTLQQTESRQDLSCPWCSLSCGRVYSLLKHMAMCHPRFHFTYTVCVELSLSVSVCVCSLVCLSVHPFVFPDVDHPVVFSGAEVLGPSHKKGGKI